MRPEQEISEDGPADDCDGPAPTGYVAIVLWSFTHGEFTKLERA